MAIDSGFLLRERGRMPMEASSPIVVSNRIIQLGRNESNVYLLKGGDEYALMGGGMIHIVPEVSSQLSALSINTDRIRRIFILHAHFDHCGIVPYFAARLKNAVVTASERARDLLKTPKVIEGCRQMNALILKKYGRESMAEEWDLDFPGIEVDETVGEGDLVSVGDLTLRILSTPGHSSCSVSAYLPEEKALFASDAGGIPFNDDIFTAANSNFDLYQESLEKMAALDVEIYLPEHYGAVTGQRAKRYLQKSIAAAQTARRQMEESLRNTGDVKKSAEALTDQVMAEVPADFLPKEVISVVMGQSLRYLAKRSPDQ